MLNIRMSKGFLSRYLFKVKSQFTYVTCLFFLCGAYNVFGVDVSGEARQVLIACFLFLD